MREKLSSIFLSSEVTVLLFVQTFLLFMLCIAFYQTLLILKSWRFGETSAQQYKLEKKSYLVSSLVSFSLLVNLLLFPFFAYTLNNLASLIPGAMCGAGVVGSNIYGNPLIIIKFFLILLSMLWLVLNKEDAHSKNYKYFRIKFLFFLALFLLILSDFTLSIVFFTHLNTEEPVLCCSNIYKNASAMPPNFVNNPLELLSTFFTLYFLLIVTLLKKQKVLSFLFIFPFIAISYYAITYFFSPYIYQLPTHKCPYCLLQSDYYFIGYFIYAFLVLGSFYTLSASVFNFDKSHSKKALIYLTLFVLILVAYPLIYLLNHKTFL